MYFKRKSNVIFRDYGSFGYITDNRNFGYRQADDAGNDIGDKIVSQSGAVFLSALGREAQALDDLATKIGGLFSDANVDIIKADAQAFYSLLESDGFVVSGDTSQECNKKDFAFSYQTVAPKGEGSSCLCNRNVQKSTQDFFDEYFHDEPQLTHLHIEITSKCNERCIHCYIPHENKVHSMDSNLFYNIINQCKNMNLLHLTLTGGEPMLHDEFIDFLQKCNEYNFSVNVLSNLTLLNAAIIEEMKMNPLLSVQVSLYSMDANVHDAITQVKGSCEATKNAIMKLVKNNIPVQISCPIMKQNLHSYIDVINWGKEHNINVGSDYVIIAKYNHTTENLNNRLTLNDVEQITTQRIKNEPQYLGQIRKAAKEKESMAPDDYVCSVCHSSICVSENGEAYPCAGWQDYTLGNLKESSLSDIWRNSDKVKYLRNLRRRDFPKCIQCPDNKFCTMCMVRNANEHPLGNPLAVNEYFCNVANLNRNLALFQEDNT